MILLCTLPIRGKVLSLYKIRVRLSSSRPFPAEPFPGAAVHHCSCCVLPWAWVRAPLHTAHWIYGLGEVSTFSVSSPVNWE